MSDTAGKTVSREQLEAILEALTDIMRGNFDRRLPVQDVQSTVDAIHSAINMTAEELSSSTVSSRYVEGILRSLADMLLVVGADGTLHTVNDAACEFLGYERDQLLGTKIDRFGSGTLVEMVASLADRDGPPVLRDIEVMLATGAGGEVPVSVNGSVLQDEPGQARTIVLIARDLRRTRQLIARAEQAATSEAILEGMVDSVVIIDLDGIIHRVNRSFEQRSGYDRREAIGEKIADLGVISRAELKRIVSEEQPRLMDTGSVENVETEAISRNGERNPVLLNMSLMKKDEEEPSLVILSARDIRDRKKDEARIEHLNRVLRSIRNVNELIVKERDRRKLIESACKLLIETRGYNRAWISLDPDSGRRPIFAQAGWGESFLPMAEFLQKGIRPPCEKMRFPRSGVLAVRDPSRDCAGCPLSDCYRGDEAMVVRLEQAGERLGFMAVSIPGDFVADFEEQSLFYEVAEDIGFALYNIGLEEERERTLEALKQSNERYRTLFDGAAEGIMVADIDTHVIRYANPALCKMLGYTLQELQQLHMPSIHPPEDREYATAEFRAQARGLRSAAINVECVRKDGRVVYADVNTSKIAAEGREYNLSFYTDVTERKLAEDRVHHLNLVLKAIRNINQLIVKEKDPEKLIDSACELLVDKRGYSKAWIAIGDGGKSPYRFAQAGWNERFEPLADLLRKGTLPACGKRALTEAGVLGIEDPLLSCDTCRLAAEYLTETVMVAPLRHGERVFGVMSASVPRELATDDEDRSLFAEVASDIGFALYGIELESARSGMEESLRRSEVMSRMGVLLGDFAHEVRNPLFAISATVDAFEARFGGREEFTQYLEVLRGELNRTKNLMHELLEYGKPTRPGRQPEAPDEVLSLALASCARVARERQVTLVNRAKCGLPGVRLDKERLIQALGNVVANAVQFSAPGDSVTLSAEQVEETGQNWLVLTVGDSGPGFGSTDLDLLFEPFFSKRRGGTGLGLTIVRRVVEDHGGEVILGDREGGGGMVRIKLPCSDAEEATA